MVLAYNSNVSVLQELDRKTMFDNFIMPFQRYYRDQKPTQYLDVNYGLFFCVKQPTKK